MIIFYKPIILIETDLIFKISFVGTVVRFFIFSLFFCFLGFSNAMEYRKIKNIPIYDTAFSGSYEECCCVSTLLCSCLYFLPSSMVSDIWVSGIVGIGWIADSDNNLHSCIINRLRKSPEKQKIQ